jgi:hypothetical protein
LGLVGGLDCPVEKIESLLAGWLNPTKYPFLKPIF